MPAVSQEALAQMVGTTRSRVNVFLKKFRQRGYIESGSAGSLTVHSSLLEMLREAAPPTTDDA